MIPVPETFPGIRVALVGERFNIGRTWRPRDPARETQLRFLARLGAFVRGHGRERLLACGLRWGASLNLLMPGPPSAWEARRAREVASSIEEELLASADLVVLVGVRVARAFRVPPELLRRTGQYLVVPHPSGLNHFWNSGEQAVYSVSWAAETACQNLTQEIAMKTPGNAKKTPAAPKTVAAKPETKPAEGATEGATAGTVEGAGEVAPEVPAAPAVPAKPAKKAPDPNEPNWKKVRRDFAALPEHRQIAIRLERAASRLGSAESKRIASWSHKNGDGLDVFAQARADIAGAKLLLQNAGAMFAQVPDEWRPGRAPSGPAKPLVLSGQVKLKGRAAKDYAEFVGKPIKLLANDEKTGRARIQFPDNTVAAVSARDLSPA